MYLGREPKNKRGFLDKKEMTEGTQKILELLELKISPSDMVKKLSAAEKQMVEIARAISADAKVLIFTAYATRS